MTADVRALIEEAREWFDSPTRNYTSRKWGLALADALEAFDAARKELAGKIETLMNRLIVEAGEHYANANQCHLDGLERQEYACDGKAGAKFEIAARLCYLVSDDARKTAPKVDTTPLGQRIFRAIDDTVKLPVVMAQAVRDAVLAVVKEIADENETLRQVADAVELRLDGAAERRRLADDRAQQRGLAAAVRAEQRQHASGQNLQADAVQHLDRAVAGVHVDELEQRLRSRRLL